MAFNENTRVKIPAILHLCRLGYGYVSLKKATRDESTNIFTNIFNESLIRINADVEPADIKKIAIEIAMPCEVDKLGLEYGKEYEMAVRMINKN